MNDPTWLVLAKEAKERLKVEMKKLLGHAFCMLETPASNARNTY